MWGQNLLIFPRSRKWETWATRPVCASNTSIHASAMSFSVTHDSGSPEHLWPDWMHRLVKFAPINMQEADGPILVRADPEQTIDTVCGDCNHGWIEPN